MAEKIDGIGTDELEEGQMRGITVGGQEVLIAKVGGNIYAVENVCPHLKAILSEGTLEGYTVTCPRHGSQFDIRTGENLRWLKGSGLTAGIAKLVKPPRPLRTFKTVIRDNRITIEI
jgi:nitrite reductase/ring-hydroxylating ferredoxin subunit